MGDTILLRRGTAANLPDLQEGEPGWCTNTKRLYIGTGAGTSEGAFQVGGENITGFYLTGTYTSAFEDALTAQNKVVLDPTKTYILDDTIILTDKMIIEGNGATITNNNAGATALFHVQGSGVRISDLNITNTVNNVTGSYNILVGLSTNTTGYHNIKIENIYSTGGDDTTDPITNVYVMGYVENVTVENCQAIGAYSGAFGAEWNQNVKSPKDIIFRNCLSNGITTDGIAFWISGGVNVLIENCTVIDSDGGGVMFYRGDKGAETNYKIVNTVRNSSFINTTDTAIDIVAQDSSGGTGDGGTLDKFVVTVENNYINGGTTGIGVIANTGSVNIVNNVIQNVTAGLAAYDSYEGLTVQGNSFYDITDLAIYLEHPRNAFISNNKFREVYTSANTLDHHAAIHVLCPAFRNRIVDNIFGEESPTTRPYDWIFLERSGTTAATRPQDNIISRNHFFRTESGQAIVNSVLTLAGDAYLAVNYIYDNVMVAGLMNLVYGAHPYQMIGTNKMVSGPLNAAPNAGTWDLGDEVRNTQVVGQPRGWICTTQGTIGTGSTTGAIDAASVTLTVASATNFYVGDYITIAGVTGIKKIIAISGTTFTIDSASDATVPAAAVAQSVPTFTALPNL